MLPVHRDIRVILPQLPERLRGDDKAERHLHLRAPAGLIRTYLLAGGKHIQFNVVDRAEMLDAQIHPEDHKELTVRVAGYSAYFIRLPKSIQDEVISRTSQEYAS